VFVCPVLETNITPKGDLVKYQSGGTFVQDPEGKKGAVDF
jgi:hypothetical protein